MIGIIRHSTQKHDNETQMAEVSEKLQILWDREPAETVICIWQDMLRMQEDQQLQSSVLHA